MNNHLYYGDNLSVLRESIKDASVDLVYLDPPFNSNASYNVLFKGPQGNESPAQIEAFDDTWSWGEEAEAAFHEVLTGGNSDVSEMLRAMRVFLGENDMMAYLTMMAATDRTAPGAERHGEFVSALRPDSQPLSEDIAGCGVWERVSSKRNYLELSPLANQSKKVSAHARCNFFLWKDRGGGDIQHIVSGSI